MLKTILNKPVLERKNLRRVVTVICVLTMLINPFTGISYADGVQKENSHKTLTSIQEEQENPEEALPALETGSSTSNTAPPCCR